MQGGNYELVYQKLNGGQRILILKECGKESFFAALAKDPNQSSKASLIERAASRLVANGINWALASKTLKLLKGATGSIAVYELRVKAKVYRVMTYLHNDVSRTPILLFDFNGHVRKSKGGIPDAIIARGETLAMIAKQLLEEESGGRK